jgi:hypothetical protein
MFTHVSPFSLLSAAAPVQMAVALGGRIAEELIFGENEITTGASGDFQQVGRRPFALCLSVVVEVCDCHPLLLLLHEPTHPGLVDDMYCVAAK